jgi:hypothetical protein
LPAINQRMQNKMYFLPRKHFFLLNLALLRFLMFSHCVVLGQMSVKWEHFLLFLEGWLKEWRHLSF